MSSRPGKGTRDGVFISYRRADAEPEARDLWRSLAKRLGDERVFIDVETLAPGDAWLGRLHEVIDGCAVMIVLIGPGWNPPADDVERGRLFAPADVVREEIARGLAGERTVIPVLVHGAPMPEAADLPVSLGTLPERQAATVDEARWPYEVERLVARVEAKVGVSAHVPLLGSVTSELIGRDELMAQIEAILVDERMLTLTGTGGTGKTSVATALIDRSAPETWAVFVDLTTVRDPARVPRAIAEAVGATEAEDGEELVAAGGLLRGRPSPFLVIDNCEHVLDSSAGAVSTLLGTVPELRILSTSREPLALQAEHVVQVPPLALPEADAPVHDAAASDSVRLFLARARVAMQSFDLDERTTRPVVDICRRLDGLPLAIELAASRVRVMDVAEIATRLSDRLDLLSRSSRDGDPRHRTIVQTLDWSYGLLEPTEALLLDRLPVFEGGFDLDAAEAACGYGGVDVLDDLPSLVDRSLVVVESTRDGTRYRLLEPVRQYAADHIPPGSDADDLSARHARCFVEFAELAGPLVRGEAEARWKRRIRQELPNLRRAITWAEQHDPEIQGRIVASFFYWPGSFNELWSMTEAAMERRGSMSSETAAELSASAAQAIYYHGDFERCIEVADAALRSDLTEQGASVALIMRGASLRMLGRVEDAIESYERVRLRSKDPWWQAFATLCIGQMAMSEGDLPAASDLLHQSLDGFSSIGDPTGRLMALTPLSMVAMRLGDPEGARELCSAAEGLVDDGTMPDDRTLLLLAQSDVRRALGDTDGAIVACRRSSRLVTDLGIGSLWPPVLVRAAGLSLDRGRPELALSLLGTSDRMSEGAGDLHSAEVAGDTTFYPPGVDETRDVAASALSPDEAQAAWQRGLDMETDAIPALIDEALN